MAATCPIGFDVQGLRQRVEATYDRVAREPAGEFHFHRGARYASEYLNYDAAELRELPEAATARFAGVGNPIRMADREPDGPGIRPGDVVLDHACGAGMDLLLAARRAGPRGHAIGIDMTATMRACAQAAAELAGLAGVVEIQAGYLEALPVTDASVDVVVSNGVVNLAPDKLAGVSRDRPGAQAGWPAVSGRRHRPTGVDPGRAPESGSVGGLHRRGHGRGRVGGAGRRRRPFEGAHRGAIRLLSPHQRPGQGRQGSVRPWGQLLRPQGGLSHGTSA